MRTRWRAASNTSSYRPVACNGRITRSTIASSRPSSSTHSPSIHRPKVERTPARTPARFWARMPALPSPLSDGLEDGGPVEADRVGVAGEVVGPEPELVPVHPGVQAPEPALPGRRLRRDRGVQRVGVRAEREVPEGEPQARVLAAHLVHDVVDVLRVRALEVAVLDDGDDGVVGADVVVAGREGRVEGHVFEGCRPRGYRPRGRAGRGSVTGRRRGHPQGEGPARPGYPTPPTPAARSTMDTTSSTVVRPRSRAYHLRSSR